MSSAELSVFIRAIGVHTPERKLTNAELSKMVDTSDEWIKTRFGISLYGTNLKMGTICIYVR